jgi:hypothetical protein
MSTVIIGLVYLAISAENARLERPLDIKIQPWKVTYFNGKELEGPPIISGYDDKIDFNWKGADPVKEVSGGRFSASWETCLVASDEQKVHFFLDADDGIRIFVDGEIIFESWKDQVLEKQRFSHSFNKGPHYMRVEYYQTGGPSKLRLLAGAHKKMLANLPVDKDAGKTSDFNNPKPCG